MCVVAETQEAAYLQLLVIVQQFDHAGSLSLQHLMQLCIPLLLSFPAKGSSYIIKSQTKICKRQLTYAEHEITCSAAEQACLVPAA